MKLLVWFTFLLATLMAPKRLPAQERSNAVVNELVEDLLRTPHNALPDDKTIRAQVTARLIKILEEPKSQKVRLPGYIPSPADPLYATCAMKALQYVAPEESLKFVDFARHTDEGLRKETVIALAESLDSRAVDAILPTLDTFPSDEAAFLLSAMHHQVTQRKRKPAPGFAEALWPKLERYLVIEKHTWSVAKLMCALDPQRALQVLCAAEMFKAENPRLQGHLYALKDAKLVVPADSLIRLLEGFLAESELSAPAAMCLEPALVLLARQKHPRAKEWIDEILAAGIPKPPPFPGKGKPAEEIFTPTSAAKRFAAAAEALLRYHGLDMDSHEIGYAVDYRKGKEKLPKAQWVAFVVTEYMYDVNGGGHEQFYGEDSEKHLVDQLPEALEEIGAKDNLELFLQSNAVWGEKNPIKNAKRLTWKDLEPTPVQKRLLDELDSRFYHLDTHQRLAAILALYVVKHAEDFRNLR